MNSFIVSKNMCNGELSCQKNFLVCPSEWHVGTKLLRTPLYYTCMPVLCIPFTFHFIIIRKLSSVLWYSWLGVRKSIRPVKIEWWGDGVVICLEGGADCLMVQLIPLHPKTPSYLASFKSRLVLSFCYRLTQVVLENRPFNGCSSSSSNVSFGRKH